MLFHAVGPPELRDAGGRVAQQAFGPPGESLEDFLSGFRERGALVGGADEIIDTIGKLAEAGLSEIQFQHFMFDRDDVPHFLAEEVAPPGRRNQDWGPQLMLVGELLTHFLGSLHQGFETCVRELDDEQIHWRHSDDTVSIAFHTWHAVRTKDNIINFVCQGPEEARLAAPGPG